MHPLIHKLTQLLSPPDAANELNLKLLKKKKQRTRKQLTIQAPAPSERIFLNLPHATTKNNSNNNTNNNNNNNHIQKAKKHLFSPYSSQILSQTQSIFFKLPPELRDRVYCFVFEDSPRTRYGSLRHSPWPVRRQGPEHRRRRHWDPDIAVLQSCRRVYTEAINLFYTKSIFKIERPHETRHLFRSLPPQRFACIRSLWIDVRVRIRCCMSCDVIEDAFDAVSWQEAAAEIGRLHQLRHLHVTFLKDRLTGAGFCAKLVEDFVIPSMMGIGHVACYEFQVNFPVKCPADAPFRIKWVSERSLGFH